MQTVSVGQKYQVVIPKQVRQVAKKIKPGRKVIVTPIDDWSVNLKVKPGADEWAAATLGMDKKTWQKTKVNDYLDKIRDEWEKRLSEIHS